ncbi:hypothetical protein AWB80_07068 [Caballeronia pedi]|uniref:Uncharacterized protein n=1 Tax=Caballeronia pedi TaxID=1777141 RepID=A0A158DKQ0_9BURK|nr:hypothetical protein AWB80_07068 [Caballeronia pedi]
MRVMDPKPRYVLLLFERHVVAFLDARRQIGV